MSQRQHTKVLLVDDEPNILIVLEFLVSREGYAVFKAGNGDEALRMMATHRPDVVVLDVMMPGMDGFEVARRIRENEAYDHTRIIFLTARGTQSDRFQGYDSGGEIYLAKPFDNEELIQILNELVEFG